MYNVLYCEFQLAKAGARCDYGLYLGASKDNAQLLPSICSGAVALKMYLNETYSTLTLDDTTSWMAVSIFISTR